MSTRPPSEDDGSSSGTCGQGARRSRRGRAIQYGPQVSAQREGGGAGAGDGRRRRARCPSRLRGCPRAFFGDVATGLAADATAQTASRGGPVANRRPAIRVGVRRARAWRGTARRGDWVLRLFHSPGAGNTMAGHQDRPDAQSRRRPRAYGCCRLTDAATRAVQRGRPPPAVGVVRAARPRPAVRKRRRPPPTAAAAPRCIHRQRVRAARPWPHDNGRATRLRRRRHRASSGDGRRATTAAAAAVLGSGGMGGRRRRGGGGERSRPSAGRPPALCPSRCKLPSCRHCIGGKWVLLGGWWCWRKAGRPFAVCDGGEPDGRRGLLRCGNWMAGCREWGGVERGRGPTACFGVGTTTGRLGKTAFRKRGPVLNPAWGRAALDPRSGSEPRYWPLGERSTPLPPSLAHPGAVVVRKCCWSSDMARVGQLKSRRHTWSVTTEVLSAYLKGPTFVLSTVASFSCGQVEGQPRGRQLTGRPTRFLAAWSRAPAHPLPPFPASSWPFWYPPRPACLMPSRRPPASPAQPAGSSPGGTPETWARAFVVDPARVLYQDERVVAFWDRSPAAAV